MAGITLGANVASLRAQRQLARTTDSLSASFKRLSSGLRINDASDDAAGLSVASILDGVGAVLRQGTRNINDGISAASIAESALGSLRDISQRQLELAEQAANGTYSLNQRSALNAEANSLVDEFNRIVQSTTFNGLSVLDPSLGSVLIQAGTGTANSIAIDFTQDLKRTVGDGTLNSGGTLASGTFTRSIASADFNGDGKMDLVATSASGNYASVYLGNNDGTFRAPVSLATGATPTVTAGDVNGDGKADLVIANYNNDNVFVMIGNGDGTFLATKTFTTPTHPLRVILGDFNNDGSVDMLTGGQLGVTSTYLLLGNGNGTFRSALQVPNGGGAGPGLAAADLNGDGKLDFLSTNYVSGTVGVVLGNGDGSFRGPITVTATNSPDTVAIGDLDGDGRLDFIVGYSTKNQIGIFLGNGDGTFRSSSSIAMIANTNTVGLADFNGDGRLDIVAAQQSAAKVIVFLGNGQGSFRAASTVSTGAGPNGLTVADLNGDGAVDVATSDFSAGDTGIFLATPVSVTTAPYLNINTAAGARDAINVVNANLARVVTQLGTIGATTSRFAIALDTLQSLRENNEAAASRIRDVDVGSESANMVSLQIKQQAAAAVLSQANIQPQLALVLLR